MAKNTDDDQEALPGIPAPAKRQIIQRIEKKCLERDRLAGERTAITVQINDLFAEIQKDIAKENLPLYTYKDANGVLQDIVRVDAVKKRKSKDNPKGNKKASAEA